MITEEIIKVTDLTKKYGNTTALDKLNFTVSKGETLGLLGSNGAGKSTFISILTCTCKPTSGDIFVKNLSIKNQAHDIKRIIGFVPQDIALYPMLSGMDNLNFWCGIYGIKGDLKKNRIDEALSITSLNDKIHHKVENYSGGMKRRLNIAVALLHHPEILVLDEPTVGIDIQSKRYIFDAIHDLKSQGRTIILVSHYIDDMNSLCDKLSVLKNGTLMVSGTKEELIQTYKKNNIEEILLEFMNDS